MSLHKLCIGLMAALLLSACQTTEVRSPDGGHAAASSHETPKYEEFIGSDETLPLQSVIDVNGDTIDLSATDKRKLVILFATHCSDSNRALKALNQSDILDDDSIEIVAIAREEDAETVIAWRDKFDIKTPLATDPDRSIFKMFAAAGIPRFITVSTDNQIIAMNLAETEDPLSLIEW